MTAPRQHALSDPDPTTAELDTKTFSYEGKTPEDTPSLRSEELVVGDYGSDRHHAFSDPKVADYWRGVYEKAKYEGRHNFDPDITWSAQEEKKLRRKVR